MLPFLFAAMLRVPVTPRMSVPVRTASVPAIAASGDQMLAVWKDSREFGALYAARLDRNGRLLDRKPIRIVPPPPTQTNRFIVYDSPAVAATSRGYIVAFLRRTGERYDPADLVLQRIARDGTLVDRQPRLIGEGIEPSIASHGSTILVTWTHGEGASGRLFDDSLHPTTREIAFGSKVSAIVPRHRGYVVVHGQPRLEAVRVRDDGTVGRIASLAPDGCVPVATATPNGVLVVYADPRGALHDVLLDDALRITGRHRLSPCGYGCYPSGVAPHGSGFLAVLNGHNPVRLATLPPLPVWDVVTAAIDENGRSEGTRVAAAKERAFAVVTCGDAIFATVSAVVGDADAGHVARVAHGRVFKPEVLTFGQPGVEVEGLLATKNGVIAFWRGGRLNSDVPLTATTIESGRVTRHVVSQKSWPIAAKTESRLLIAEGLSAHVTTIAGRPVSTFALPSPSAVSDGKHWLFVLSPARLVRTSLDGSAREERSFDPQFGAPWSGACNEHGCLFASLENDGRLRTMVLPSDQPLSAAEWRTTNVIVASPGVQVGGGPNGYLIAYLAHDRATRAALIDARGNVMKDVLIEPADGLLTRFVRAGGGADGFEVVTFLNYTNAYHVGMDGSVRPLGRIERCDPQDAIRGNAHGYILCRDDRNLVAVMTE